MLSAAAEDAKQAAEWYNQKKAGLGKEFLFELRKTINYIKKNPETVAVRYDSTRTVLLDRFPFLVHFSIDSSKKLILISAVLHTSRSPNKWNRRT